MNSISTALAGIQSASNRFDSAAQKIANDDAPVNTTDLAAQVVELTSAQNSVKLNAAVIHTQEEIDHTLLDIRV